MCLTGNDYVSLPEITDNGSIISAGLLSMEKRGLIEFYGNPGLAVPSILVNGKEINILRHYLESYWIPCFVYEAGDLKIASRIITPRFNKGFAYAFEFRNEMADDATIELNMSLSISRVMHTVNESKSFRGVVDSSFASWSGMPLYEIFADFPFAAMAVLTSSSSDWKQQGSDFEFSKTISLKKGEVISYTFYFGFGFEEVAAVTAARELERWGDKALYNTLLDFLNGVIKPLDIAESVIYRNLFFSFFYSTGLTFDTEECVCVTSRSPKYYVSAAYWDRDSLLWAFPAICKVDLKRAREVIAYVATRQRKNIGIHSRYIDGSLLEPGFELDELMAPIIAIDEYIRLSNDESVLEDGDVSLLIKLILSRLEEWKAFDGLYATFLQPTDDMNVIPVLCYDNALVFQVFTILSKWNWNGLSAFFLDKAMDIKASIERNFIKTIGGIKQYVWSYDGTERFEIYDEPPGSLVLLPQTGIVDIDNETYLNTVRRITDPSYEFSFASFEYGAIGCPHAPHPWILSMANLIRIKKDTGMLEKVLAAPMDGGLACESIDENSGECTTGNAFATCAGFLATSLLKIMEA